MALIVVGGLLAAWPALEYARESAAVDACLDAGGSFDYAHSRCDQTEVHPFVVYTERHLALSGLATAGAVVLATGIAAFLLDRRRRTR